MYMNKKIRREMYYVFTIINYIGFFAGILGTLIGGTQTFICTGFAGLLVIIFNHCGIDTTFLNEVISNNLFLNSFNLTSP